MGWTARCTWACCSRGRTATRTPCANAGSCGGGGCCGATGAGAGATSGSGSGAAAGCCCCWSACCWSACWSPAAALASAACSFCCCCCCCCASCCCMCWWCWICAISTSCCCGSATTCWAVAVVVREGSAPSLAERSSAPAYQITSYQVTPPRRSHSDHNPITRRSRSHLQPLSFQVGPKLLQRRPLHHLLQRRGRQPLGRQLRRDHLVQQRQRGVSGGAAGCDPVAARCCCCCCCWRSCCSCCSCCSCSCCWRSCSCCSCCWRSCSCSCSCCYCRCCRCCWLSTPGINPHPFSSYPTTTPNPTHPRLKPHQVAAPHPTGPHRRRDARRQRIQAPPAAGAELRVVGAPLPADLVEAEPLETGGAPQLGDGVLHAEASVARRDPELLLLVVVGGWGVGGCGVGGGFDWVRVSFGRWLCVGGFWGWVLGVEMGHPFARWMVKAGSWSWMGNRSRAPVKALSSEAHTAGACCRLFKFYRAYSLKSNLKIFPIIKSDNVIHVLPPRPTQPTAHQRRRRCK